MATVFGLIECYNGQPVNLTICLDEDQALAESRCVRGLGREAFILPAEVSPGQIMGRSRSEKKAAAARKNATRPRKKKTDNG